MQYAFLMIAIVAEVIGTTFMKESAGFSKLLPSIAAFIAYGFAFYFLAQTLRYIPTGVAYAIWSGVGVVLIALAAWIFQGQKLDAAAIIGMTLIVAGVIVMNIFSKSAVH